MRFLSYWIILASMLIVSAPSMAADIPLTAEEKNWLKNHSQIRLAVDIAWPPLNISMKIITMSVWRQNVSIW